MWPNRTTPKQETQKPATVDWVAEASWIENWVKYLIKSDKHFFQKRELVVEDKIPFADPTKYAVELVGEIVKNLGLSSKDIVVTFSGVSSAGKVEQDSAGAYFIEIANKWSGSRQAIAAIVAHELAHVWMGKQQFSGADVPINEGLTDVTTILLGLGVLVMNGLGIVVKTDGSQFKIENYISNNDMGYLLSVFLAQKNIDPGEIKKKMNDAAIAAFDSGNAKFVKRQDEIRNSRQAESWIVLCSGCFQKLRVPGHAKNIEMTCPLCSKLTKYNGK